MAFGEKLKRFRDNRKETQHTVAMRTNIDSTLISKFERGTRLPTNKQIQQLAVHFNIDEKQLAVEARAGKILSEYGGDEITYRAVMHVREEIKKYYAGKQAGGKKCKKI